MQSIALETYIVQLKKINQEEKINFDSFEGDQKFRDIIYEYFDSRKKSSIKEDEEKVIRTNSVNRFKETCIHGVIERGKYGYQSEILNVDTGGQYSKNNNEAEMIPFFFIFYLPDNSEKGILILETFGAKGCKNDLSKDIRGYISKRFNGVRAEINSLSPKKAIEEYLDKGKIKKMRFIKHEMPKELSDWHSKNKGSSSGVLFEVSLSASRGKDLGMFREKVIDMINNKKNRDEMIEIQKLNFSYDEIKAQFDVGGKQRTVNLVEKHNIRGRFDITDEVEIDEGGHPKFLSINTEAYNLIKEISNRMNI